MAAATAVDGFPGGGRSGRVSGSISGGSAGRTPSPSFSSGKVVRRAKVAAVTPQANPAAGSAPPQQPPPPPPVPKRGNKKKKDLVTPGVGPGGDAAGGSKAKAHKIVINLDDKNKFTEEVTV